MLKKIISIFLIFILCFSFNVVKSVAVENEEVYNSDIFKYPAIVRCNHNGESSLPGINYMVEYNGSSTGYLPYISFSKKRINKILNDISLILTKKYKKSVNIENVSFTSSDDDILKIYKQNNKYKGKLNKLGLCYINLYENNNFVTKIQFCNFYFKNKTYHSENRNKGVLYYYRKNGDRIEWKVKMPSNFKTNSEINLITRETNDSPALISPGNSKLTKCYTKKTNSIFSKKFKKKFRLKSTSALYVDIYNCRAIDIVAIDRGTGYYHKNATYKMKIEVLITPQNNKDSYFEIKAKQFKKLKNKKWYIMKNLAHGSSI